MKPPFSENIRWYLLVLGLTAVLVLLAWLQYRSTRQVSDATTEHMRASLQDSLMDLRQGMERELTPLCYAFESNDGIPRNSATRDYLNRLERWHRGAAHPGLVRGVLVARALAADRPELLQLDENQDRATAMEWPKDLLPLRGWMRQVAPQTLHYEGSSGDSDDGPMARAAARGAHPSFPWSIDESIPALVHAELEIDRDAKGNTVGTMAWIVIRLDAQELGRSVFPELVQKNFGRASEAAYKIAVLAGADSSDLIYSSDGKFRGAGDELFDASLNLFGPPSLWRGGRRGPAEHAPSAGGHLAPAASGVAGLPNEAMGDDEAGLVQIEPIHHGDDEDSDWELVARHRQGSVEAAVADSYHRNLAINFGVLLLLGATMALVIATSRRASRLARSQVDFVAGVSHELRTPLTGIVAAAQNIADGVVEDPQRTVRYGKAILGQAKQLTDLVEQILLFSATHKGAHRYHLQLADVEEILEEAFQTTASLTGSAGFAVHCTIQPGLPQVRVDAQALSQCLQNLITNSVKYSGASRWIGIEANCAMDAVYGREVRIAVEDRGLGMEAAELQRIFEPFYRSPLVTAAQIHGSGLGLPLTKSMVEAMGGRLSVRSEPKKGSRFAIHLPVPSGALASAGTRTG